MTERKDSENRHSFAFSQASTMGEIVPRNSNADSQTSTVRENSISKDITSLDDMSIKEEDEKLSFYSIVDDNQTAFQFTYTDQKIPEEIHVHPIQLQDQFIKVPGQERITIADDPPFPRSFHHAPTVTEERKRHPWIKKMVESKFYTWIKKQCKSNSNRYAFQMSVAFMIAAMFVIIDPISNIFPNAFWIGVSVVTVLDNTVGGLLTLSLQRFLGTLIGGAGSITIMTVTRVAFHPEWEWEAVVLLCSLMFIQVFFISLIKSNANYSYVGNIGLLTTVILILAGYSDLVNQRLSYIAEMGAWRTFNLILGIIIASSVSFVVFPLKASSVMRQNLGQAMEEAAELYAMSSGYYLDFSGTTVGTVDQTLAAKEARKLPEQRRTETIAETSLTDAINRTFSTRPPDLSAEIQNQIRQQLEDSTKFWTHEAITNISNKAFEILASFQTESTRLRNVSNEYNIQIVLHFIGSGKERCKRDLRRAKRYNEAIEAMKRVVWPLVSFRLLLPLISMSQTTTRLDEATQGESHSPTHTPDSLRERIQPTKEVLDSFSDSLRVMRLLGEILKCYDRPVSDFQDEWMEIDRMVTAGNLHIQRELKQTVKISMYSQNIDGLKLLSYYGFLVRCSMIWDGLRTVSEKLSPLNGTLSRASSMGLGTPLPNRESMPAAE